MNMCNHGAGCLCGKWNVPIGRVLIGFIFVLSGFMKLTTFGGTTDMLGQMGLPLPMLLAILAIIFELGGGLMLVLGFHARTAAWMLIVFTAIATVLVHLHPDMNNQIAILKNISIIGGLMYVTAYGSGMWSLSKWNTKCCMGGALCPDCKVEMGEDKTSAMPMVK